MIMFTLHPTLENDSIVLGDLPLSRVLLIKDSQYPWLVLVPRRESIREIYELSSADQQQFWHESAELGKALMHVFDGDKLNIGALGNMVPQLHIHHIVRYINDPAWPAPIWGKHPMYNYTENTLAEFKAKFAQCQLTDFTAA